MQTLAIRKHRLLCQTFVLNIFGPEEAPNPESWVLFFFPPLKNPQRGRWIRSARNYISRFIVLDSIMALPPPPSSRVPEIFLCRRFSPQSTSSGSHSIFFGVIPQAFFLLGETVLPHYHFFVRFRLFSPFSITSFSIQP